MRPWRQCTPCAARVLYRLPPRDCCCGCCGCCPCCLPQNKMLEELDQDVDTTSSRLKAAQKKMQEIIRKSGSNTQLVLIVVLIIILVLLAVFVFI